MKGTPCSSPPIPKTGRLVFINATQTLKCYGCFLNSRKLVFCHASLLKAAVYNHNQTTHLLLSSIIPDAVDAKKDWLRDTVELLWVSKSSNTSEESSKTQQSGILHICSKCFKLIWLLLFFFITDHHFLTWVCFLLTEIALWSFFNE